MKARIACAVVALVLVTSSWAQDWKQIESHVPPLPAFQPQIPKRVQLPNGMVLLLQEDHELPLIDGVMRIRGGSREEPAAKVGMLDIYGDVWRTGGTKTQTGDQLDDVLEARAAKVETDNQVDSTTISFSCLKGDFEDVFRIFNDVLQNPAFREDKIAIAQDQMNTGIARRNDDIGAIAGREAGKLAYGAQNPYARAAEYATVAAVTREDLVRWHEAYVHPNNIIFGMVGDFDSAQMEARLRKAYGAWAKGPQFKAADAPPDPAKPGVYFVPKTDVNQSSIQLIAPGTTKNNPDYFAISVMNEVLSGGFNSRLVGEIRTKLGLAYSVGGGVGTGFDHPGMFRTAEGTKSSTTVQSIDELEKVLAGMVTKPATDEEVKRAKDSILNSFVFNFDSKAKVLRERMAYEFYGYPLDFLERYRDGIEKATREDVARVAQKYIPPKDQLRILVVGNPSEFDKPLTTLGQVTTLDITIPPPPAEKPAARPAAAKPGTKPATKPVKK